MMLCMLLLYKFAHACRLLVFYILALFKNLFGRYTHIKAYYWNIPFSGCQYPRHCSSQYVEESTTKDQFVKVNSKKG